MKGLVLNLGMKSIRAIIFDEKGKQVAQAYHEVTTYIDHTRVEQDAEEWWNHGLNCLKEVLKDTQVDFITVSASAACLVPVDKAGNPIRRVIMVSDKRAAGQAEKKKVMPEFKALGSSTNYYYSLPRIMWMRDHEPELYHKTHKFLSPNDFFIAKMTGEFVIDEMNATKYHTVNNKYPQELIDALEITRDQLPRIVPIGEKISCSKAFLEQIGISYDVPVIVSTYDAITAFFGCGVEEGEAVDMSGTVTSVRVLTKTPLSQSESRIMELAYGDQFITGGSNNLGGGLLGWTLECFYGEKDFCKIEKQADNFVAKDGLIFLPYVMGERAPLWNKNIRGTFLGIERFHTNEHKVRAVLESTGYIVQHFLKTLEQNNINVKKLYVGGGMSKIDCVNQIKADVLGIPVIKLTETEATALGSYALARQSLDDNFSVKDVVTIEKEYVPNLERHEIYKKCYSLFRRAGKDLERFYEERNSLLSSINESQVTL